MTSQYLAGMRKNFRGCYNRKKTGLVPINILLVVDTITKEEENRKPVYSIQEQEEIARLKDNPPRRSIIDDLSENFEKTNVRSQHLFIATGTFGFLLWALSEITIRIIRDREFTSNEEMIRWLDISEKLMDVNTIGLFILLVSIIAILTIIMFRLKMLGNR